MIRELFKKPAFTKDQIELVDITGQIPDEPTTPGAKLFHDRENLIRLYRLVSVLRSPHERSLSSYHRDLAHHGLIVLKKQALPGSARIVGALSKGALVGLSAYREIETAEGTSCGRLEAVSVAPEFQGRGIGRILLQDVRDFAISRDQPYIEGDASRHCIALYEQLGAVAVGPKKDNLIPMRIMIQSPSSDT